jgi:hypothetical protein
MRNWEQAVEAILFSTREIEKIEQSKKGIAKSKLSEQDKTDRIDEKEQDLNGCWISVSMCCAISLSTHQPTWITNSELKSFRN